MERERTRGIFNENTRVWACPKRETQHKASQRISTARYSYSQMDILRDSDNPRITVWITTYCCADYTPTFECDSWFRAVIAMKVKSTFPGYSTTCSHPRVLAINKISTGGMLILITGLYGPLLPGVGSLEWSSPKSPIQTMTDQDRGPGSALDRELWKFVCRSVQYRSQPWNLLNQTDQIPLV